MKKYCIIISALLVLALSVPAFSSPLSFSGGVDTKVTYTRPDMSTSGALAVWGQVRLNAALSTPGGLVTLSGYGASTNNFVGGGWSAFAPIGVTRGNITIQGAFREGGQDLTTVIGDYQIGNTWYQGARITGIKLGDNITGEYRLESNLNRTSGIFSIAGDPLSGGINIISTAGDLTYNGNATLKASQDVTVTGAYNSVGSTYKFTGTVKAADNVTLYGDIDHNQAYKVQGTVGLAEAPFSPTIIAGWEKVAVNDAGYYVQANAKMDAISAQVKYNNRANTTNVVAGTGSLYSFAAGGNVIDPIGRGETGYVGIYNQAAGTTGQFGARIALGDLIDLGVADGTTITGALNMITNIDTGNITTNKLGVIVGTNFSAAGFNNIATTATLVSDLVANTSDVTLNAKYTAPNGIAFDATRAAAGNFTVVASKSINF